MTLKWDDAMIPWSESSKNDGAVPMSFRWWWDLRVWNSRVFSLRRWVKWATSSATSESCKLENFSGVMSSGRMFTGEPFPTWVPTHCEHFGCQVSSIPANFGQRMWWSLDAQRVGFFYSTAVHGGQFCKSIAQSKCLRVWSFLDIYFLLKQQVIFEITNHSSCLKEKSCMIWAKIATPNKKTLTISRAKHSTLRLPFSEVWV